MAASYKRRRKWRSHIIDLEAAYITTFGNLTIFAGHVPCQGCHTGIISISARVSSSSARNRRLSARCSRNGTTSWSPKRHFNVFLSEPLSLVVSTENYAKLYKYLPFYMSFTMRWGVQILETTKSPDTSKKPLNSGSTQTSSCKA